LKLNSIIVFFSAVLCFTAPISVRADFWGADVAVLAQILQNAILQLSELKAILQSGQDTFGLLQDINRGINDSLRLAERLGIHVDANLYKDLHTVSDAVSLLQNIYGKPVDSPLAQSQQNTDSAVAEALTLNNQIDDYIVKVQKISDDIKDYSHEVSPGGAAKLTAESLGVLIHVSSEQLRAQATGLKLQAQALAMTNKKHKDETAAYLSQAKILGDVLGNYQFSPKFPRY
jgi:hypothetical protein